MGQEGCRNPFQGPADGEDGADGKGLFELAVERGFEGTLDEFIEAQKAACAECTPVVMLPTCNPGQTLIANASGNLVCANVEAQFDPTAYQVERFVRRECFVVGGETLEGYVYQMSNLDGEAVGAVLIRDTAGNSYSTWVAGNCCDLCPVPDPGDPPVDPCLNNTTEPTVVITTPTTDVEGAFNVTITFSESVNSFTIADIILTNATVSNFAGGGAIYTATITPSSEGNGTVTIPAGAAQDVCNNNSQVGTLNFTYDIVDRECVWVNATDGPNSDGKVCLAANGVAQEVTFSTKLGCHLNKLLTPVVELWSGKRMNFGEICLSQTNDAQYYGTVQAELLDRIKFFNDNGEDISTTVWAASTDYGTGYPCMMYQADANGITYSGPQAANWEQHYSDNDFNGVNWSALDFDFSNASNGGTNSANPYPNGFGAIADNIMTQAIAEDMIDKGVNVVRLPIRWERLESDITDGTTVNFEAGYKGLIDTIYDNVENANTVKGSSMKVFIDIHNYGGYAQPNGQAALIDDIQAEYNAFLIAVVNEWSGHSAWAGIDIMNEPRLLNNAGEWKVVSQSAYDALRASGYTGVIIIETFPWAGLQDVLANHADGPWINEVGGNDQNLIYSFHWYPDPNNGNISVGSQGNTPWDQYESQTDSENFSVCDPAFDSYQTGAGTGECREYQKQEQRYSDDNSICGGTRYVDTENGTTLTDISGYTSCDCSDTGTPPDDGEGALTEIDLCKFGTKAYGEVTNSNLSNFSAEGSEFSGGQENVSIVNTAEANSGCAMQARFIPDASGSSDIYAEMNIPCDTDNDVWVSYRVKFLPGFEFVKGGKLNGVGGGSTPTGGITSQNDLDTGFTARLMWGGGSGSQNFNLYAYYNGMPTNFPGTTFGEYTDTGVTPQVDQWYNIVMHVALNTPGQSDGVIEMWIGGQKVATLSGLELRKQGQSWCIDHFLISMFYGGGDPSWSPSQTTELLLADIRIGRSGADVTF